MDAFGFILLGAAIMLALVLLKERLRGIFRANPAGLREVGAAL